MIPDNFTTNENSTLILLNENENENENRIERNIFENGQKAWPKWKCEWGKCGCTLPPTHPRTFTHSPKDGKKMTQSKMMKLHFKSGVRQTLVPLCRFPNMIRGWCVSVNVACYSLACQVILFFSFIILTNRCETVSVCIYPPCAGQNQTHIMAHASADAAILGKFYCNLLLIAETFGRAVWRHVCVHFFFLFRFNHISIYYHFRHLPNISGVYIKRTKKFTGFCCDDDDYYWMKR